MNGPERWARINEAKRRILELTGKKTHYMGMAPRIVVFLGGVEQKQLGYFKCGLDAYEVLVLHLEENKG